MEEIELAPSPSADGMVEDEPRGELVYIKQILTKRELTMLYVDFGHLPQSDNALADAIQKQYYRFLPSMHRVLWNLVAEYAPNYLKIDLTAASTDSANLQSQRFNIAFYHLPLDSGIRDLCTEN
jgi:DNA replication licensing factor MCM6